MHLLTLVLTLTFASCASRTFATQAASRRDTRGESFFIRQLSPPPQSKTVRSDAVIRIFFNESLDPSNDLSALITIAPPVRQITSRIDQHIVLVIPERLQYGTTYSITVAPGFKSANRKGHTQVMKVPTTWTFTTVTNAEEERALLTKDNGQEALALRVQGGACNNSSRDHINADGRIALEAGRLFITVSSLPIATHPAERRYNGLVRSAGFLRRRLKGWVNPSCTSAEDLYPVRSEPYVVCFKLRHGFLDYLRQTAVPEPVSRQFPSRPLLVDPRGGDDQYGLQLDADQSKLDAARLPRTAYCQPQASKGCNGEANQRSPEQLPADDKSRIAEVLQGPCFRDHLDPLDPQDIDLVIDADHPR
jgi:hypothetical protein